MTFTGALLITGITAAFIFFALVLAWGEYQTRGLNQNVVPKPARQSPKKEQVVVQSRPPARGNDEKLAAGATSEREFA